MSVFLNAHRWLTLMFIFCVIVIFGYYTSRYLLLTSKCSIKQLRLHNNKAFVVLRNNKKISASIKKVCVTTQWVVIICEKNQFILIDEMMMALTEYKSVRRQLSIYHKS